MYLSALLPPLIFLIGSSCVTGLTHSLHILGPICGEKTLTQKSHIYYAYAFVRRLFPENPWDHLLSLLSITKHLLRLLYATTFFLYILTKIEGQGPLPPPFSYSLLSIVIVIFVGLLTNFFIHFIASTRGDGSFFAILRK